MVDLLGSASWAIECHTARMGKRTQLVGPPAFATLLGIAAGVLAIVLVVFVRGPEAIAIALVVAIAAWRLLGLSVGLIGDELVVRNLLNTVRYPVGEVGVQPRVSETGLMPLNVVQFVFPPTKRMDDDSTPYEAKYYMIEHGGSPHPVHALLFRPPKQHEEQGQQLRQAVLSAQGDDQA